ncbi:ABC transporter permease [Flammeovirga aprica]|uniref:FtsX-like permease family protein n=1 Tax=Flammeovirga aprica JL-4 TaxID=694437 RepID=A0A7X9S106_9BACT|nr:ABC transporter permease [Flammeovirga aprica]NME72423.1 FtsX-like permease family protein [Flammeovirga aprica JL-4]
MFLNLIQEPLENLLSHKVRNITTGLGVSWGLLILILLLGGGEGLYNGIKKVFSGYSKNTVWVYGGVTSLVYKGEVEGKRVSFSEEFLNGLMKKFSEIDQLGIEVEYAEQVKTTYLNRNLRSVLKGVNNDFFELKNFPLKRGRYFNPIDRQQQRNVCVIGGYQQKNLYNDESAIGKTITIGNRPYLIIGEVDSDNLFAQSESRTIFLPLETYQNQFQKDDAYSSFGVALSKESEEGFVTDRLKPYLSKILGFDTNDANAIYVLETKEQRKSFDRLFQYLNSFLWGIGISLLLSGVISICNMMVLGVKERTKELGIRKALGASPRELLVMIITESALLTLVSGTLGIFLGLGGLELLNYFFFEASDNQMIEHLSINPMMIFMALLLLLFAGIIAGFIPAKRAMDLTVVEALNEEN